MAEASWLTSLPKPAGNWVIKKARSLARRRTNWLNVSRIAFLLTLALRDYRETKPTGWYSAFQGYYLADPYCPLYTLDELAGILKRFAKHLHLNKESLIAHGLPDARFHHSFWLDRHLGNMCFTEMPTHIHGCSYVQLGYWLTVPESISGHEKQQLSGFQETDLKRLAELRSRFFDLKLSVVKLLAGAIERNQPGKLKDELVELVLRELTLSEIGFLFNTSRRYSDLDLEVGISTGVSVNLLGGGLRELLAVAGHVATELAISRYCNTRKALANLVTYDHIRRPYLTVYRFVTPGGEERDDVLKNALKLFTGLRRRELAVATDFALGFNQALATGQEWPPTDMYSSNLSELCKEGDEEAEAQESEITTSDEPRSIRGLTSTPACANSLENMGATWMIRFEGKQVSVRDTKGMKYISHLLQNPGRDVHVLEMAGMTASTDPRDSVLDCSESISVRKSLGSAGEILDKTAVDNYKSRLKELKKNREKAQSLSGPQKDRIIAKIDEEESMIKKQLATALGPKGKLREDRDTGERARKSVQMAIDRCLKSIEKQHKEAWAHLHNSIKKGFYCSYKPEKPTDWIIN